MEDTISDITTRIAHDMGVRWQRWCALGFVLLAHVALAVFVLWQSRHNPRHIEEMARPPVHTMIIEEPVAAGAVPPPPPPPAAMAPPSVDIPPPVIDVPPPPRAITTPKKVSKAPRPSPARAAPAAEAPSAPSPSRQGPPHPPGPSGPPGPPVPDRPAGNVPVNRVTLHYPQDMQSEGREGKVVLSCDVEADGHATNCHVVRSVGGSSFVTEALRFAYRSRFSPATLRGVPVKERNHRFNITFTLSN